MNVNWCVLGMRSKISVSKSYPREVEVAVSAPTLSLPRVVPFTCCEHRNKTDWGKIVR